jgi:hypothetical protein
MGTARSVAVGEEPAVILDLLLRSAAKSKIISIGAPGL